MSAMEEKERISGDSPRGESSASLLPTINPAIEKPEPPKAGLPSAVYVIAWIAASSGVILFNKRILDDRTAPFRFPVVLTTWHLTFGTIMTQILARTTTLLDGRKKVKMTGRVYLRAIMPIGFFFSLSLICGNKTYLYLSVSFIQMLKATTPVAVLLITWAMGLAPPNLKTLGKVSIIVVGVIIASIGEIAFDRTGFLYQISGVVFEAVRLAMIEALLSSAEFKMDPLVSFYYFAPVCAVMNGAVAFFMEFPSLTLDAILRVGIGTLIANGLVAFALNVCLVLLIGKTSSLVLTLCGVLKDILLVVASMIIFGSKVSGLQVFGYGIALCGMLYYRLGADALKGYLAEGGRRWAQYGVTHPAQRKVLIVVMATLTFFILLGGIAPTVGVGSVRDGKSMVSGILGGGESST